MKPSLAAWSSDNGIKLNQVAQDTGFSVSTVYKISSEVTGASANFRLAFLKKYGVQAYREAFGEPEKTDEIRVYMEVTKNAEL